jgi:hypothetical protein
VRAGRRPGSTGRQLGSRARWLGSGGSGLPRRGAGCGRWTWCWHRAAPSPTREGRSLAILTDQSSGRPSRVGPRAHPCRGAAPRPARRAWNWDASAAHVGRVWTRSAGRASGAATPAALPRASATRAAGASFLPGPPGQRAGVPVFGVARREPGNAASVPLVPPEPRWPYRRTLPAPCAGKWQGRGSRRAPRLPTPRMMRRGWTEQPSDRLRCPLAANTGPLSTGPPEPPTQAPGHDRDVAVPPPLARWTWPPRYRHRFAQRTKEQNVSGRSPSETSGNRSWPR